jgi:hypothetical protein
VRLRNFCLLCRVLLVYLKSSYARSLRFILGGPLMTWQPMSLHQSLHHIGRTISCICCPRNYALAGLLLQWKACWTG